MGIDTHQPTLEGAARQRMLRRSGSPLRQSFVVHGNFGYTLGDPTIQVLLALALISSGEPARRHEQLDSG